MIDEKKTLKTIIWHAFACRNTISYNIAVVRAPDNTQLAKFREYLTEIGPISLQYNLYRDWEEYNLFLNCKKIYRRHSRHYSNKLDIMLPGSYSDDGTLMNTQIREISEII